MTRNADTPPDSLFAVLYAELRQIAQRELRRNSGGGALSRTTLLHEAYLTLQRRPGTVLSERGSRGVTSRRPGREL